MNYKVKQGDTLVSIALEHGFGDWRSIYDADENSEFRELRPNPSTIFPDDEIFIPNKITESIETETNKKKSFRLKKQQVWVSIQLINSSQEKLSDVPYSIGFYDNEDKELESLQDLSSDSDGIIEHATPANTKYAIVNYTPYSSRPHLTKSIKLIPGLLDPVNTESGLKSRLNHFGFNVGEDKAKDTEELFVAQLEAFKSKHNLNDDASLHEFLENPTQLA